MDLNQSREMREAHLAAAKRAEGVILELHDTED